MRSKVDLPQPEGPDQHQKFAIGDIDIDVIEDADMTEQFVKMSNPDVGHLVT